MCAEDADMKKFLNVLASTILTGAAVLLLAPVLMLKVDAASTQEPVSTVSSVTTRDLTAINAAVTEVNQNLRDEGYPELLQAVAAASASGKTDVNVSFIKSKYEELEDKDKQKAMSIVLSSIQGNDQMSASIRVKLYNFIAKEDEPTSALVRSLSEDVSSDFAGSYGFFRTHVAPIISWVLGIMVLVIFIFLAFSVVLDLSFMVIPPIQMTFLALGTKSGKTKGKPPLISVEAYDAVLESDKSAGSGDFKSPLGMYFLHSIKKYVLVAICVLYMSTGRIFTLFADIIDLFSGFLR